MKFYFVYILKCSDGLTYTGITNNISRRINEHKLGLNKTYFTFKRRPVELIFQQEFNNSISAIQFEKRIKNWSAKKKIALAEGKFDLLQILSESRNASHSKYKPDE